MPADLYKSYLLLGSNIGDSRLYLEQAVALISSKIGETVQASSLYTSEPWGFSSEQWFVNQVIEIETHLTPEELLQNLLLIEKKLGRERNNAQYASRTIDIDILFYENKIIQTELLIIPHPRLHLRKFVLLPLAEIAPDFVHPVLKKNIKTLLDECPDKLKVNKVTMNLLP